MKRMLVLCVMFILSLAGAAQADSDRILMEQSTAVLNSDGSYTSDTYLTETFRYLAVTVVSDQSSAAGGVKIEQSCDNDCDTAVSPVFQYVSAWTYTAGSSDNQYVAELNCKCTRVRYVNGPLAQGSFHITSYLKLD
jgi:hypothetical protein